MMSKLFIALIVIRNSAFYFVTGISEICRHEDTKNMVSKLFIALIVINISAFFDRNFCNSQFSKFSKVESIGNPAGIGQGTGFGLRERDRDGIGLGQSRLRAMGFTTIQ